MTEHEHELFAELGRERKAVTIAAQLHRGGFTVETAQHLHAEFGTSFREAVAVIANVNPPSNAAWGRVLEIMAMFEHPYLDVDVDVFFTDVRRALS